MKRNHIYYSVRGNKKWENYGDDIGTKILARTETKKEVMNIIERLKKQGYVNFETITTKIQVLLP